MKTKNYEAPAMSLRIVEVEERICTGSTNVNTGEGGEGGTSAGGQEDHGIITPGWE